jgi:hypothetical protein
MKTKLAAISILFWSLTSHLCFGQGETWIGAKDAGTASYSWKLKGDYFIVDVLVNGQSPFTCGLIEVYDGSAVGLGEDGQCDIRSSFFDGEVSILVSGFVNSQKEPVESSQVTIYKDTIYPEITFQDGKLSVSDLNLDPDSITCRNESTKSSGCPNQEFNPGTWTVSASDKANNTSKLTFQIP